MYSPADEQTQLFLNTQAWIKQQIEVGNFTLTTLTESHMADGLSPENANKLISTILKRIHTGELDRNTIFQCNYLIE